MEINICLSFVYKSKQPSGKVNVAQNRCFCLLDCYYMMVYIISYVYSWIMLEYCN